MSAAVERQRLPHRRAGLRITLGQGPNSLVLCTGEYPDGRLGEVFLDHQKEGTFGRDMLKAFAMALSLALQHGVPLSVLAHTFRGFRMEPDFVRQIFEVLESTYGTGAEVRP